MDATRSKRVTKVQKFMLVQYLEEHTDFAFERGNSVMMQWSSLAQKLNPRGGAQKDGYGWRKAWLNMRHKAKHKSVEIQNALDNSGRNDYLPEKLTDLDLRILNIMSKMPNGGPEEINEELIETESIETVDFIEEGAHKEIPSLVSEPKWPMHRTIRRKNTSLEETSNKMFRFEKRKFASYLVEKKRKNCILEKQTGSIAKLSEIIAKQSESIEKLTETMLNQSEIIARQNDLLQKQSEDMQASLYLLMTQNDFRSF